jgi:citrate lyase beta subunit
VGRGAVTLDGKMVDLPIVRQAERLLAEARPRQAGSPPG